MGGVAQDAGHLVIVASQACNGQGEVVTSRRSLISRQHPALAGG